MDDDAGGVIEYAAVDGELPDGRIAAQPGVFVQAGVAVRLVQRFEKTMRQNAFVLQVVENA